MKNALIMSVYCVTVYSICVLVMVETGFVLCAVQVEIEGSIELDYRIYAIINVEMSTVKGYRL